jgi:hypothetical protein
VMAKRKRIFHRIKNHCTSLAVRCRCNNDVKGSNITPSCPHDLCAVGFFQRCTTVRNW